MALNNLDLLRYTRNAIRSNLPKEAAHRETVERGSESGSAPADTYSNASEEEKLDRLLALVQASDETLERRAAVLEQQGVPEGIVKHSLLREAQVVEQADILQCVNSGRERQTTIPEYEQLYEQYLCCGLPDDYMPAQPQCKEHTELVPCERIVDGVSYVLYGDPETERQRMIRRQGTSRYEMRGTCGLCSTGNVLTMAGAEQAGEEDIIGLAFHASRDLIDTMSVFDPDPAGRGGTTSANRKDLLAMRGIESFYLRVQPNRDQTMREVAQLVKAGHGVILSVEVARLWGTQKGGHAITVAAVTEDEQTFFYCDTGNGQFKSIPASKLGYCLTGNPCNVTKYPIR